MYYTHVLYSKVLYSVHSYTVLSTHCTLHITQYTVLIYRLGGNQQTKLYHFAIIPCTAVYSPILCCIAPYCNVLFHTVQAYNMIPFHRIVYRFVGQDVHKRQLRLTFSKWETGWPNTGPHNQPTRGLGQGKRSKND